MSEATKKYALVTGSNKGIGIEICRQLASKGIVVVLTARDEKRGLEALNKLKGESGLSDYLVFHQVDVTDISSINSLANFIKSQFGKLDILAHHLNSGQISWIMVNNAGVGGAMVNEEGHFKAAMAKMREGVSTIDWGGILTETYELAEEFLNINYYGAKRVSEALIPLLQLSDSPRIVNVSSSMGKLQNVGNEWAKEVLGDAENLTEEKVDQVLSEFLKDFKEGALESKGWAPRMHAYIISKAAMTAYTRLLAKKYPTFCINSVSPGYVKTDMNVGAGKLSAEEGAESLVRLALLPNGGPSGLFFSRNEVAPFNYKQSAFIPSSHGNLYFHPAKTRG